MSDELIIRHCSPTLAGLKTGNIFTVNNISPTELSEYIDRINRKLKPKGLMSLALSCSKERAIVYVYRPQRLEQDLQETTAIKILKSSGYTSTKADSCIHCLAQRLRNSLDFPHEIGLFLGYPPEDVKGFIENKAGNYKCVGCWKVYGDEKRAKLLFNRYKKCSEVYLRKWQMGSTIEKLTVQRYYQLNNR